jgi:outer membrane protein assembly factor BamE
VVLEGEPQILGYLVLALFDLSIKEFFNPAALQAYQVVVVRALVELINRLARFEIAPFEHTGLLELGEHPVNRGQPDILILGKQLLENIFGAHMALAPGLKHLQDFQTRQRGLKADIFEFVGSWHGSSRGFSPLNAYHIGLYRLNRACRIMSLAFLSPFIPAGSRLPVVIGAISLVSLLLGGCVSRDPNRSGILEPYRFSLPQGNYVTQEMVDQLKPGMNREQVRFVMGSPLLISGFRNDRWDYVFRFQYPNRKAELRRVVVRFENERVAAIDADALPQRDDNNDPALPGYRAPSAKSTPAR